jgi:hypothetical protein
MFVLLDGEAAGGGGGEDWQRRRLPSLAIELDRYLGRGFLAERHMYCALLGAAEPADMADVLDVWQIRY